MHQRTNKKIIIYLFLFTILASVNNFKYINLQLFKIDLINISGLNDTENSNLYEKITDYKKKNIFFIDNIEISKNINSNNLVEKFWVFKEYPSTININLIKTNFLGITKINNIDYLIGSNGKLIKKRNDQVIDLPFIFGRLDVNDFLILKEILDKEGLTKCDKKLTVKKMTEVFRKYKDEKRYQDVLLGFSMRKKKADKS